MSTILYKDKVKKISPINLTLLGILVLGINLLAFYLFYSTYSQQEQLIQVKLEESLEFSDPSSDLSEFRGEKPDKAFSATQELTDSFSGAQVKYPLGWQALFSNGTALIKKDNCGSSGALIYPAFVSSNITAQKIGEDFSVLLSNLPGLRENLTFGDFSQGNNIATGLVAGKICNQQIRGQIESLIDNGLAQVRFFWGNPDEFDSLKLSWRDVFNSFSVSGNTQYLRVGGENFQVGLPDEWSMLEVVDGLDLEDDNRRIIFRLLKEDDPIDTSTSLDVVADNYIARLSLIEDNEDGFEISGSQVVSEQSVQYNLNGKDWDIYWRILDFESSGIAKRAVLTIARPKDTLEVVLSWRDALRSNWGQASKELELIERTLHIKEGSELISGLPFVVPVAGSSFIESLTASLQIKLLEDRNNLNPLLLATEQIYSKALSVDVWVSRAQRLGNRSYSIILPDGSSEIIEY